MPAGRDGNLKIGDSDIDALNFGTGEVTDVYLGDKHVWTNGSLLLCLQNNTANEIAILGYTNGVRNNRHDVPSSVLRTTHDFAWDGESVLSLNRSDNNVFGYTNGVRDSSKDISTSVLHSNSISGWHLAWDGESVLIFDSTHALLPNVQDSISVYGFTNGARDTSKDISSFVINAALEDGGTNTHHFGLTWDGESLLLLHRSGTVRKVYGFTNGARDTSKDISTSVINSVEGGSIRDITWDGESVLINYSNEAVYGFTNGASDSSKDIAASVFIPAG